MHNSLEESFVTAADQPKQSVKIQVTKNGPYMVSGNVPLYRMVIKCNGDSNTPVEWLITEKYKTRASYALCRCGHSSNKPFCDGTHIKIGFNGTEEYDDVPFEQMAKTIEGPALTLKDAEILCASARFCHRGGDIWDQIPKTDDPQLKENCIRNEVDCPSGRLVVIDKASGQAVEPKLEQSIGVIEDPSVGVGGPLWVRGGIPVYSADGKVYLVRNRVTLCRCGKSTIKPFCDSSHYPEDYQEER
jgi:CDGSH-type Zn-finger protein